MGKVGSYSAYRSIKRLRRYRIFHTHHFVRSQLREHLRHAKPQGHVIDSLHYLNACQEHDHTKIIINIREPMSRNVSAFFENLVHSGVDEQVANRTDIDEIIEAFLDRYPHYVPERWFRDHLEEPFGIDLMRVATPEQRHYVFDRVEVLIIRAEDGDARQLELMREFLDAPDLEMVRMNDSTAKSYAELNRRFKLAFVPSPAMLDRLFSADFFRAFYTPEEQTSIRAYWANTSPERERELDNAIQEAIAEMRWELAVGAE